MFPDNIKRTKTIGQPPGTPIYTGNKTTQIPKITVIHYDEENFNQVTGTEFEECLREYQEKGVTWLNIDGLHDIQLIEKIAKQFKLHPLTVEDILNVDQRSKVEEYEGYIYATCKLIVWHQKTHTFSTEQLSIVFSKNFVISFQEHENTIFDNIRKRLSSSPNQRLRQQGSDYLVYRLIDTVVDQYFFVVEGLSDQIEKLEESIISSTKPQTPRTLYRLKRQLLLLRKAIWPMREAISHLSHIEGSMITSFTRLYLRDVYDHTVQAIDTLETYRDMITSMLDMYLSTLTNRMNEIMKTLTIIATIFIPITWVASVYGMNFEFMPELHWRWGYPIVLSTMLLITILMLTYFRRKKWI